MFVRSVQPLKGFTMPIDRIRTALALEAIRAAVRVDFAANPGSFPANVWSIR